MNEPLFARRQLLQSMLAGNSQDTVDWDISGGQAPPADAPASIGDRCYIGPNIVIPKGVRIGDGASSAPTVWCSPTSWYSPSNAQRFSEAEVRAIVEDNRMSERFFHAEEARYSGRFVGA